MGTMTLEAPTQVVETTTSNDAPKSAHIVFVPPTPGQTMTATALVLAARIEGFEVEALCGYRWVPCQNPAVLPVCEACLEVYQSPGEHRDEREELPAA